MNWQHPPTKADTDPRLRAFLPEGAEAGAPADDGPHPVDQVAVRKLGGFNLITVRQWRALRRPERLRLIKEELVTFLYQDAEVPIRSALLWIKATGAPAPEAAASEAAHQVTHQVAHTATPQVTVDPFPWADPGGEIRPQGT